jgi:hypothetical protein
MPAPTRFSEMLFKNLDRAESLMLALLISGVVCHFMHWSFADQVLVLAFGGLAVVFFLNAYRPPSTSTPDQADRKDFFTLLMQTILPKLLWISSAVGAAALAMVHQHAPKAGYLQMFMIQSVVAIVCLVAVGLAAAQGKNVQHLVPILYRAIPLTLAAGHFLGYY